jgi:hypothetical protein
MKSFNRVLVTSALVVLSIVLLSCKETPINSVPLTKFWKLKVKEVWWVSPNDASGDYISIDVVPFGIDFPDANATHHIYSGTEYNIVRTDSTSGGSSKSINFVWTQFPDTIEAGKMYTLYYQSKGTALNGISISYPLKYDIHPTAWSPVSMRDGEKAITFKIAEPTDSIPSLMKMVVTMTSGSYYNLDYLYIYEWIKEK